MKINIDLADFIKSTIFNNIIIWKFEDECMYLHMDLTNKNNESQYWSKLVAERQELRDEFFKQNRDLLPPNRLKELQRKEESSPKKALL